MTVMTGNCPDCNAKVQYYITLKRDGEGGELKKLPDGSVEVEYHLIDHLCSVKNSTPGTCPNCGGKYRRYWDGWLKGHKPLGSKYSDPRCESGGWPEESDPGN